MVLGVAAVVAATAGNGFRTGASQAAALPPPRCSVDTSTTPEVFVMIKT